MLTRRARPGVGASGFLDESPGAVRSAGGRREAWLPCIPPEAAVIDGVITARQLHEEMHTFIVLVVSRCSRCSRTHRGVVAFWYVFVLGELFRIPPIWLPAHRRTASCAPPSMHPCAPYAGSMHRGRVRHARNPRWLRQLRCSWKSPSESRKPHRSPSSEANSCSTPPCGTRKSGTGTCSPAPGWRRWEGRSDARAARPTAPRPAPTRPGPTGRAGRPAAAPRPAGCGRSTPRHRSCCRPGAPSTRSTYRSRPVSWRWPGWSG